MKGTGAAVILSLLCLSFVSDPSPHADTLEWNEYRHLTWADFRGKRAEDAAGDAGSAVQIKAKPYTVKDKVYYDVTAFFVTNKSWSDAQSPELLAHEQLHFDLAELYARKIRKEIVELQRSEDHDVKHYNKIVQRLLSESNEEDVLYDLETLHGAMIGKQKEWSDRIKHDLYQLQPYKKQKHVISRSQ